MHRARSLAAAAIVALLCVATVSCRGRKPPPQLSPSKEIRWLGKGGGFAVWGATNDGIYGVHVKPNVFEIWKWDGPELNSYLSIPLSDTLTVVPLPGDRYAASFRMHPVQVLDAREDKVIRSWGYEQGWGVSILGLSRNRAFIVAVMQPERPTFEEPDKLGIRLLDVERLELRRCEDITGEGYGALSSAAVSDDGKHIAIGGWDNLVIVLDAVSGREVWRGRPPDSPLKDVVFSSNGATIFATDPIGMVYEMDFRTGKVKGRWCATSSDEPIYGQRISALAVSPDEKWIAAGTGPEGEVYLWNTQTGRKWLLNHGLITILVVSFSPDSKHVVSMAGGMLKIWDVPVMPGE